MIETLLEVSNLTVKTGKFSLKNISFDLKAEEYLIVLGPTGSGKTILLETLAGLRTLQDGKILLMDQNITHLPPEQRNFGFAYQDSLLYPFLTVKDNILFGAKARGVAGETKIQKRMRQLVEIMNISHLIERYPRNLSGGEKQRVSLARAILTQPSLLLLDEPLSALDPATRQLMKNLLREIHNTERLGIIHVTHDFSEAIQMGTKIIVLNNGSIEQSGAPLDIFFRPASLSLAQFLQGENLIGGTLISQNNQTWFKPSNNEPMLGPLNDSSVNGLEKHKPVVMMIRSGNLFLHRQYDSSQEFISWSAEINHLSFDRTHVDVFCKGNGSWQTSLSLSQWLNLELSEGDLVKLSVKPENCHFISC
ncbi:ABC transporter related [Desulfofarcimen acetoxidans DSM 771]|jgi:molybdate transport system ATP-binding protein|uniref:ABC transporter related n=1 Tax=Desulfofarcimen acetoxidans (strain ATCC 49208 / DSM 771 / KCTC 5769 / VKM B-1644 / 5575) TaxID=485916 RepID=C8W6R3_DESAS|nr:ABC transporter ATP-binding protein [Desulfofarcimen acetoxidans]ACV64172.1 ABC transporter related [Desulfofarcimen acetoxidans DSM 771]